MRTSEPGAWCFSVFVCCLAAAAAQVRAASIWVEGENASGTAVIKHEFVEAPAGRYGFLKRSGVHLQFKKAGAQAQFWGCGANLDAGRFHRAQLAQRARYLRTHGVNMVRQHTVRSELGPLVGSQFDPERFDAWDWWCAELRMNGIYMTWSVFYDNPIGTSDGYDPALFNELEVSDRRQSLRKTYGLVNVEPQLQDVQLRYLSAAALLLHKNPYTGLRPVDDPALAVIEFQYVDCIFSYS